MATVVPVDDFTGEWYPGFKPEHIASPYIVDGTGPFTKEDEDKFWYLDFHWSRGLTPLAAFAWGHDGYCWGTQHAAEALPLPPGRGITSRFAGTHLYGSAIPESDPREIGARANRLGTNLPHFLQNYQQIWAAGRDELEATWTYFRGIDLTQEPTSRLPELLTQARRYHQRSMEIHFGVMYPLLVNFLGFYGACAEMGIDTNQIGKFLQGEDTKIMETDRELYKLAIKARQAGLSDVFADNEPPQLREALSRHGGSASQWLTDFDDFLQIYGYRQEATCDVGLPSWIEDNQIPLGLIKTFLLKKEDHDFEAAARNAIAEREAAIDAARTGLTKEEQAVFDAGLASNQAANFPWWQDDHNYYIDLKVMLPLRWTCQELANRVGADHKDDMLYLFWPELLDVANGKPYKGELSGLVKDRRQYFDHWQAKRSAMPKVMGTIPDAVEDPVLIEIFGLNPQAIKAVQNPDAANATTLSGVPAAKGVATGIARVLQSSDELHRLEPGSILVCESTSPNWTPAFGKIAGAVCDGGGMLSHAAIVGREYGIPTVTAVGVATLAIADGDEIEVDGTNGKVTILKKAAELAEAEAAAR
ncbi:PEP-utilizing enzyme [Pseudonocardia bannensis]|uniref:PEP-utilizing protein mobile subunit n=1 Tax=Pseudonocardia bannensis TaxID=630973 RepID=A0A848DCH4_9PSEU|nr:PEP-utilizing enzyme [Pseudonocardia bannensis]NMH90299.1 PEP-utilizing protein mobile subunit [Pseudonocardia bannensis]